MTGGGCGAPGGGAATPGNGKKRPGKRESVHNIPKVVDK